MNSLEKSLVDLLILPLSEQGFKWVKSQERFIRKENYGFCEFAWSSFSTLVDGGDAIQLDFFLGIRHDVVDDVVNQLGLIYGDAAKRCTTTVQRGLSYFPIVEGKNYTQYIRRSSMTDDIRRIADEVIRMMMDEGVKFYTKYASLLECSQGLNFPIESATHALCNNLATRAYYGVAVACLVEPQRVPTLVQQYLDFMKTFTGIPYELVVNRLAKIQTITGVV